MNSQSTDPELATYDWGAAAEVMRRDLYPAPLEEK